MGVQHRVITGSNPVLATKIKVMKEELLKYCYKHQKAYVYDNDQLEFDCLVELIDSGTVTTFEELAKYGMEY